MSLIDELKRSIKNKKSFKYDPNREYDEEEDGEDAKEPWTIATISDITSNAAIIDSLTREDEFTYDTSKSKNEFRRLFLVLCRTEEEMLFDKLANENS
jgi:hypothetical protein